jgi:hypothetical protein
MPGMWEPLNNQPPFSASTMQLLTDGTVMCQDGGGAGWWRLRSDVTGDYVDGTWSPLASMHHSRLYYASAVLRDGSVVIAGGEYSDAGSETNTAELYHPPLDYWVDVPSPPGWGSVGDAPCCVLPDGRLLVGSIDSTETAIFDPVTETWTAAASKDDSSSEETWVLLPDDTVVAVECSAHPKAEKYVIDADKWVSAGMLPVELVQASSIEIGPGMALPDGRAFFAGATGHTALYTPPPIANQPGSWEVGPDLPNNLGAKDAPGCLMPNGKVLLVASPQGEGGDYPSPTHFSEFDPGSMTITAIPDPPNNGGPCYTGRMMLLPTGQVLFTAGSPAAYVYTPDGTFEDDWRPEIVSCPRHLRAKQTFTLNGEQLTGLSQAVSYGDDAGLATNYPLVRIRNLQTGHVRYCRTFDHSTMAIGTGETTQHTSFKVPAGMETGRAELEVVVNGIPSEPIRVHVGPFRLHFPFDEAMVNSLIGSLADGPLWVLGPHGPVPVDPWGPRIGQEAEAARDEIVRGVRELQRLGAEVQRFREDADRFEGPVVHSDARRRDADDSRG